MSYLANLAFILVTFLAYPAFSATEGPSDSSIEWLRDYPLNSSTLSIDPEDYKAYMDEVKKISGRSDKKELMDTLYPMISDKELPSGSRGLILRVVASFGDQWSTPLSFLIDIAKDYRDEVEDGEENLGVRFVVETCNLLDAIPVNERAASLDILKGFDLSIPPGYLLKTIQDQEVPAEDRYKLLELYSEMRDPFGYKKSKDPLKFEYNEYSDFLIFFAIHRNEKDFMDALRKLAALLNDFPPQPFTSFRKGALEKIHASSAP